MYLNPSFLNFSAFYEPKYPKAHQSYTWDNTLVNMNIVCENANAFFFGDVHLIFLQNLKSS